MSDDATIVTALRDGSRVLIRQARPSDAAALKAGFCDLSQHSRMMRFLQASPRLSDSEFMRFVSPDHTRHEALGAIVLTDTESVPAGIAHFFRPSDTSPRAELALTVIDRMQGKGIGTLLLGRLLRAAARLRITALDAIVHTENRAMIGLLLRLGAAPVRQSGDRAFVLPVHQDPADYPDNRAGDGVRAAWYLDIERRAA